MIKCTLPEMEWPQEDGIIGYYPLTAITVNVFLFLMQIVIDITSLLYMLLHFRYANEINRSFIFISESCVLSRTE